MISGQPVREHEHVKLAEQWQAERLQPSLQRGVAAHGEQRTQRGKRRRKIAAAAAAAAAAASAATAAAAAVQVARQLQDCRLGPERAAPLQELEAELREERRGRRGARLARVRGRGSVRAWARVRVRARARARARVGGGGRRAEERSAALSSAARVSRSAAACAERSPERLAPFHPCLG